jgi:hypothetical protein
MNILINKLKVNILNGLDIVIWGATTKKKGKLFSMLLAKTD